MKIVHVVPDESECEITGLEACHDSDCPLHGPDSDNYDPTPWCDRCGSRTRKGCDCLPIADNE